MPLGKQSYRKRGGPNWVSASMGNMGKQVNAPGYNSLQETRQTASTYIGSIMYPGSNTGIKIPDFNLYPTVTAHTEREGTFSCSATGNGGMLVRLHAGRGPGNADGAGGAIDIQDPTTTSDAAFTYLALQNVRANPAAFAASYKYVRLVSASLEVQFVGNDNQNSGRIVQGVLVKDEYIAANFVSFNQILAARDNMTSNVEGGAYCRYRPVDESSFDFVDVASTAGAENQGAFIIAVNASGAGAPFRYKLSCNWECIIRSDQYDQPISDLAGQSPCDPKAMDEAKKTMGAIPGSNLLTGQIITKNDHNPEKATSEAGSLISSIAGSVADIAEVYGGVPGIAAKFFNKWRTNTQSKIAARKPPALSTRTSTKAANFKRAFKTYNPGKNVWRP